MFSNLGGTGTGSIPRRSIRPSPAGTGSLAGSIVDAVAGSIVDVVAGSTIVDASGELIIILSLEFILTL